MNQDDAKTKPLVSLIIPAYNVEHYIRRAICSGLSQTYENIELLVVDDGSDDKTWEKIGSYQEEKRFRCFRQVNSGVSKARNKALSEAKGKYVLFLDADDWLEENAVERLVELQQKVLDRLIAVECFYVYKQGNGPERKVRQGVGAHSFSASTYQSMFLFGPKGRAHVGSSCYKLFSRDVIEQNHLRFDETISHTEDGLFVFNYLKNCAGLYYEPIPLWNILERPGSATTSGYSNKLLSSVDAINKMIAYPGNSLEITRHLSSFKVHEALRIMEMGFESSRMTEKDYGVLRDTVRGADTKSLRLSGIDRLRKAVYPNAPRFVSRMLAVAIKSIKARGR